jgi:hypothetical protein
MRIVHASAEQIAHVVRHHDFVPRHWFALYLSHRSTVDEWISFLKEPRFALL